MANYQIITDSCCDLYEHQYRDLGVTYVPLNLIFDGAEHTNFSDDASIRAFYQRLREGMTATTSAVNPDGWAGAMIPVLEKGEDVLVITFSSGLSTTSQSAVIAAEELREKYPNRKIRVVDSLCAAMGQGLLVTLAANKRAEGMNLDDLSAWVEETRHHICHWVTVDDLNHLKRGGRISAATAMVGTMLSIKPIIRMDENGKLENTTKIRGRKNAIAYIAQKMDEHITDRSLAFIAHGDCMEDALALEKLVRETYGVQKTQIGNVGGVIGAHTGPGVLVVFFVGDHR